MDDYYSTPASGEAPYSTCLSYVDGQYQECLLSSFDSNKKILLAKKNGKVIGRAVIRLTKGGIICEMMSMLRPWSSPI